MFAKNLKRVAKAVLKRTRVEECKKVKDATKRLTTGVNGNTYISVIERDERGRTTIIREIKASKASEFASMMNTEVTAPANTAESITYQKKSITYPGKTKELKEGKMKIMFMKMMEKL